MALQCIAYVSTAHRRDIPTEEIDALLVDARAFNQSHGVTGVLLFSDGNYFQYLEGSPESVALVYQRVLQASGHFAIIELVNMRVDRRQFSSWSMGFAKVAQSELQEISHASWAEQRDTLSQQADIHSGVALLLSYWDRHCHPQLSGNSG